MLPSGSSGLPRERLTARRGGSVSPRPAEVDVTKRAGRAAESGALVVGGGFLGSHVAAGFTAAGVPVTLLTRTAPSSASTARRIEGARVIEADAADPEAMDDALSGCGHVVWCAGGLLPGDSNADPIGDVLSALPAFLTGLEAVRRRPGVGVTLFSSGGTVYGNPAVLPVPETHPVSPLTSYAVMKVAAEHYLSLYHELYGVRELVLRCGNVFGEGQPSDRSQGLVAAVLARVLAGEPVPLYGDGSAVRDYVHIDDVVSVMLALTGRSDVPAVLNVGTATATSVTELLTLVEQVTGRTVRVERRDARPGDVRSVVLDVSLLRSLMAYDPLPLRDGLARSWAALSEAALTPR